MDQDELGNYLLCVIAKSSRNQKIKKNMSCHDLRWNIRPRTTKRKWWKSGKDHVAVFEVLLEGFSKLYEAHNLHSVCCQFSPTVTKDSGTFGRPKVIIKKENLED